MGWHFDTIERRVSLVRYFHVRHLAKIRSLEIDHSLLARYHKIISQRIF